MEMYFVTNIIIRFIRVTYDSAEFYYFLVIQTMFTYAQNLKCEIRERTIKKLFNEALHL